MLLFHSSPRCSFPSIALLSLLVTLFTPSALVAAQGDDDLGWVLFDREQFDGNTALDGNGDVQLFWKTGDEYSTYGIAARSEGYLALGFSETGAMTGADIALGYRDDEGEFVLENRFAAGFVTPELSNDQTNNIRLVEGDQRDGVTAFVFEKKNKADCLQNQVDVTKDSWQWFIYAFSDDNTLAQHAAGKNGKKYVKLGTGRTISVNEARDVPDSEEFSIIQPEITISTNETTYCYSLHKLPEGAKNFILGERPTSSSDLLHHLVVYSCYGLPEEEAQALLGQEPTCGLGVQNPCFGFVAEWAPGMTGRTFEPGFGKPFGSDSYEYVMLETHYNNPEGLEGQTDSSGYTFLYNDQPVETEIGTLTLGDIEVTGWTLEPGRDLVSRSSVCVPECTERWPAEGITAFSVFFHMHQRGRNLRVQIIRDGEEIDLLSSIRSFEYGYQYSKTFGEVKLLPGDRLITTCDWDTSEDDEPVPGGLASNDEMCFAWVDYYPANQVTVCSQTDLSRIPELGMNGTAGLCVEAGGRPEDFIVPTEAITAPFERLPESGNTCAIAATVDEPTNRDPSRTSPAAAASSTSAASSAFSALYQALFTTGASLALVAIVTVQLL